MISTRTVTTAALALALGSGAFLTSAFADTVDMDPQSITDDAGSTIPFTVKLLADAQGEGGNDVPGCNATATAPVTITFGSDKSWASAAPGSVQVTDCTTVHNVDLIIGAGAPDGEHAKLTGIASGGLQGVPVEVKSKGVTTTHLMDSTFREDFINVHVDNPTVTPPAPPARVNVAPTVTTAAVDSTQPEGGPAQSASGAFSDDVAGMTITKLSGDGTFTADNAAGTWSWSHSTPDDATGSVTVRATDSDGAHTDDTFTWTTTNVAPTITGVAQSRQGACAVTLDPSATDPGGVHDPLTESILWSDGSTAFARTFPAAGTYSAVVTVADDDGGSDTETVSGVRAYNKPSTIMEPINTTGTRSGFKQGSTVPVKITVTGCDGAPVTNIVPIVNLVEGDTVADVPVNEATVTEVATNGKEMRWSTDKYIYNLSTKLSQHLGKALSGTYTVSVNHSSFERSVNATFDVRK